jgi:peptidoglycan hydrolase-like protein with peptidoglycan-binding domain/3D (Asp-Asp-Asp) domain-containing protein
MKITGILKRAIIDLTLVSFAFFVWTSALVAPVLAETGDVPNTVAAAPSYPYNHTFTITAYYSPLPCQDYYTTGSYEGDKRLNGNGVAGADGTAVFPGMIAAPKVYSFGTKMNIPGVGTVAVHDRGGAILAGGGREGVYDRLDIWMGYGDVGLKRALTWGRRTVDVTVYGNDPSVKELITLSPAYSASEAVPKSCETPVVVETPKITEVPKVIEKPQIIEEKEIELLDESLDFGDSGESVVELQRELASLHFLKVEPSGVYDDLTRHAVFKFQQSQYLVGDSSSAGAGTFGPKTAGKLNSIVALRQNTTRMIASANTVDTTAFRDGFALSRELDPGAVSEDVRFLQNFLKDHGYFNHGAITNYFGPVTKEALIAFQIDHGIVANAGSIGAGRLGKGTLSVINDLI